MATVLLSPCGTSVLTNRAPEPLRKLITQHANAKTLPREVEVELVAHVEARTTLLANASVEDARLASAELNGLLSFWNGHIPEGRAGVPDIAFFLASDTWLGRATATMISDWVRNRGVQSIVHTPSDLSTASLASFQLAMGELARWCDDTFERYREQRYRIVFNLTGGFKSINGFLQALGMTYADETIYVFESGAELLRLPRLPYRLDAEPILRSSFDAFRRLALEIALDEAQVVGVPETMLFRLDGRVLLSAWGQLLWARGKNVLYEEDVHPPPSQRVRLGPTFKRSVSHLDPARRSKLNARLDQLVRVCELGVRLSGVDLKALSGAVGRSTHEVDAWSDHGAKRLFCHYEGEVLVIDELGDHL